MSDIETIINDIERDTLTYEELSKLISDFYLSLNMDWWGRGVMNSIVQLWSVVASLGPHEFYYSEQYLKPEMNYLMKLWLFDEPLHCSDPRVSSDISKLKDYVNSLNTSLIQLPEETRCRTMEDLVAYMLDSRLRRPLTYFILDDSEKMDWNTYKSQLFHKSSVSTLKVGDGKIESYTFTSDVLRLGIILAEVRQARLILGDEREVIQSLMTNSNIIKLVKEFEDEHYS